MSKRAHAPRGYSVDSGGEAVYDPALPDDRPSIYVDHPPAPWSPEYRERVRRAHRMRAFTLGYSWWEKRGDELTAAEEDGRKRCLTKDDFNAFGAER